MDVKQHSTQQQHLSNKRFVSFDPLTVGPQDSLEAVRQLAEFLGLQCSEANRRTVDTACGFDNMKLTKGQLETDSAGQPIMYRKGEC